MSCSRAFYISGESSNTTKIFWTVCWVCNVLGLYTRCFLVYISHIDTHTPSCNNRWHYASNNYDSPCSDLYVQFQLGSLNLSRYMYLHCGPGPLRTVLPSSGEPVCAFITRHYEPTVVELPGSIPSCEIYVLVTLLAECARIFKYTF